MEWAGHVWRAEGSIIQKVLNNNLTGKRPRGRPQQRWRDRLNADIADIRMVDEAASFETASDRDKWRGLVKAAKGLKAPKAKKKSILINVLSIYLINFTER